MNTRIAALLASTALSVPAFAHHSNAAFDVETVKELKGTVTRFDWMNPHIWISVQVDDGKGSSQEWRLEGRPPGVLSRAGWSAHALNYGDKITIYYSPAKDGTHTGLVARVTLADGTILPNSPPQTESK